MGGVERACHFGPVLSLNLIGLPYEALFGGQWIVVHWPRMQSVRTRLTIWPKAAILKRAQLQRRLTPLPALWPKPLGVAAVWAGARCLDRGGEGGSRTLA